jgi:Fur family transcriptional regulator, ferric uptake regulator
MPITHDATTRIEKLCADQGLRLTEQRRVIARVLSAASDHPNVEEVYRRAVAVEPTIALSTVYRTVKLFEDHGMLERHDFGPHDFGQHVPPGARFEPTSASHHDHLIDVETGRVIEFYSPEIEALQERIAKELGFELVGHKLQLFGSPAKRRAGSARPEPRTDNRSDEDQ